MDVAREGLKASVRLQRFHRDYYSSTHAMLAPLSNATINSTSHVDAKCRQKLCVENCGQTATDSDMVNIDSQ